MSSATQESPKESLLKVLSGNHQGAEVTFGYETAIIGASDECDVVLTDTLISPKHLELTFAADGVTIKALENSKVFVDGRLIGEEPTKVDNFQFITLGSTQIIIGPANQPWPSLSAADAPSLETEATAVEEEETPAIQDEITLDDQNLSKLKKHKLILFGGSFLILFGFSVALLFFLSMFQDTPEPIIEKPDVMKQLQQAVSDMGLSNDVTITKNQNGFVASGYTVSNEDLSAIRSKLSMIEPTIRRKIYSEEKILSEIAALLSSIESRPKVQAISNGVFLITGYAYDKDNWVKTRKRIIEDVPGIIDLQDEVILPAKAYSLARPIIAKYKLSDKVGILPQPDGIAIGGLVSTDEQENWMLAKMQIEKTFGDDILLKNYVKISDPEVIKQQYFGSEVSSVSISENGINWISFKDGSKYRVGSTLSNGFLIKEINPDNIILTKGSQTIILKIGELK